MSDQYDAILRSLDAGALITLNNQPNVGETPSGELEVMSSRNDKTEVYTTGGSGEFYTIRRAQNGDLVYSRATEDGGDYQGEVITIEIVGIA
jgi:hypothetical protein